MPGSRQLWCALLARAPEVEKPPANPWFANGGCTTLNVVEGHRLLRNLHPLNYLLRTQVSVVALVNIFTKH
jgi:hypothetical protein